MKKNIFVYLLATVLLATAPLYGQKGLPLKSMSSKISSPTLQQLKQRLAQLQQENARLIAANARERTYQTRLFDRAKHALFRAVPAAQQISVNSYTGTVFEVTRNGRKEVFGAIAMHTLQDPYDSPGLLDKEFSAVIVRNNQFKELRARVVQLSSSAMADLALVKFRPEDERLFQPISLEEISLAFPAQGYSEGYACNLLSKQTFPIVGTTSTGMLKSHLPAVERGQRAGFCGSPVFTKDFKFAGIHVGSSYEDHSGYISPVSTLKNLVASYYNPNLKPQVITLAGQEIGRLTMTEFVQTIEFLNADQQIVWEKETISKFSLSDAEKEIQKREDVAFIRLRLGNSHWRINEKGRHVMDDLASTRVIVTPWPHK